MFLHAVADNVQHSHTQALFFLIPILTLPLPMPQFFHLLFQKGYRNILLSHFHRCLREKPVAHFLENIAPCIEFVLLLLPF